MTPLDPVTLPLEGAAVIEASAGTGKTYTITTLVLRLLWELRLGIDQILVVTYTRAATAELRDRIRARLRVAQSAARGEHVDDPFVTHMVESARARGVLDALAQILDRALFEVDEAPVLTIHGFCQLVLSEHAFESNAALDMELSAHSAPMLEEIAADYYVRELAGAPRERAALLAGHGPDKLHELAARAAQDPSLRIVPEHVPAQRFDEAAWRDAHARCRALWRDERDTIVQLVASLPATRNHVAGWAARWDGWMDDARPGFSAANGVEAAFRNFTRSGIAEKLAKKKDVIAPTHAFFDAAEELARQEEQRTGAQRALTLSFQRQFVDYARAELAARTRASGVRTFDSLLHELHGALSGPHAEALSSVLRGRYRAALVDEFQDTDPVQYAIFDRLFGGGRAPLFMIGDPKQAIYGFRGADVHAYLAARAHVGERVFTLDTNRRSDPSLIAALNGLYARVANPFALTDIEYYAVRAPEGLEDAFAPTDGGAPVEVLLLDGSASADALRNDVARRTAAEIVRLLESESTRVERGRRRRLVPSDVAVLCRTNDQARLVQEALSERFVPSVFQGDESVFESVDATEIGRALSAMAHPGDARTLRSFLCSMYGGLDASELARLEDDDARWDEHRERIQRVHELWVSQGFMQAIRGLVGVYDVERTLLARPDGTRRVTNLWHLCELLAEASLSQRLGPLGLLRFLAIVRDDPAMRSELVGDAHELRLEGGEQAVVLTTVHKSKGLEYPVVFCPYAWSANARKDTLVRFHDEQAGGALTLDLGSDDAEEHRTFAAAEALAEDLRLLYVALTRAKHRVVLLYATQKASAGSALAYTLLGGGGVDTVKTRAAELDPSRLLEVLREGHEPSQVAVRLAPPASAARYTSTRKATRELAAKSMRRAFDGAHRTASFTALATQSRGPASEAGRDYDSLDADANAEPASPVLPLDAFPRGAVAGQLVHTVLERVRFDADRETLAAVCRSVLEEYRHPASLAEVLVAGLEGVLRAPLDDGGLTLADVPDEARLNEMEFLLPVTGALTPQTLAATFRDAKAPAAIPRYESALRTLTFEKLTGYLRGFIDLVFEHDGRFYIVDYKSNRLGPRVEHYGQEAVAQAMAEHHYVLQYHLYALAVHRYLRTRVADYDYERRFGGVFYLFLRGMAPEHPPGTSVFFDRPSASLVDALDTLFGARKEGGA